MTSAPAPRPARPATMRSAAAPPATDFLKSIKTGGSGLPQRVVLHGTEGVGKTSFGAHAPNPIFLQSRGETGLETLIDSGRVPETPHFPEATSWADALGSVRSLISGDHDYRTLVIDTLNGLEMLCHEHVCEREYRGEWGNKGFASYQQGYKSSIGEWRIFLAALDELRSKRQMGIVGLAHTNVQPYRNPDGEDYDRYVVAVHRMTWEVTSRWADMVLFANFYTYVSTEGNRPKGQGGNQRVLYTERHAAYDAKNRSGLPPEIDMGTTGAEAYAAFREALAAAKGGA